MGSFSNLTIAGMLAGGVGIFLLAVGMITDGLKLAAGSGLRAMLGRWTRSPLHGVLSGFLITAVVQSSSAITVATIGFVNAGLLTLTQALGVVFGANIGTTVTGWLVASIGFEINISAFSLPLIGLGMLLRLTGSQSTRGAIGTALAGFGLFFIGIQILTDAFEGIVAAFEIERYTLDGVAGLLLYLGVGFLMTVLTQSSSAAIALTLTAASSGLLGMYAAGAMVIGANVGTTSTAVLSVIGATPNAKRVAAAHVLFNGITGVVALFLLPVIFFIVNAVGSMLNIELQPSASLALFHTVFNILGVIIMLPFTIKLSSYLTTRFVTRDETLGEPQYIDKNVSATPDLALNAAILELTHLAGLTRQLDTLVLLSRKTKKADARALHNAIVKLVLAIGEFVMNLQRSAIPQEVAEALPRVLRCSQYFLASAEHAIEVDQHAKQLHAIKDHQIQTTQAALYREVQAALELAHIENPDFSSSALEQKISELKAHYDEHKEANLNSSVAGDLSMQTVSELLESNSSVRRMATQMGKGISVLVQLHGQINKEFGDKIRDEELHDAMV